MTRSARKVFFLVAALAASVASARTDLVWDAPAWETPPAGETGEPGCLTLETGAQHTLVFGGNVVTARHEVTERSFAFGRTPFDVGAHGWVRRVSGGGILLASGRKDSSGGSEICRGRLVRRPSIGLVDLVVIGAYFAGMLLLGVVFMKRSRNSDDYFRGGGRLPWWAVSLSIYATMFSSITFLSIPAWSFMTDCRYAPLAIGTIALVPVVLKWYLPYFRRLNLTSAYEFLEVRYNLACRLFASAMFIFFMVVRTAIVAYLPAVAIAAVTGVDVNLAIVAVVAVTIVYCTMGGIEAVIWGDFTQSLILFAGTGAIFYFLVTGSDGGFAGYLREGWDAGKFSFFDLSLDWTRPVFWVVVIGGIVTNLASYTSDQCVVQRYMATKDEVSAGKSIVMNGALSFFNCLVFFALGVALWTFFRSHPELLDVTMPKSDAVMPLFIADCMPSGLRGLVFGAVAAATMSTLSTNLNSAATAVTVDFYDRLFRGVTDRGRLVCGKVTTVVFGLVGGAFALLLANTDVASVYDVFQVMIGTLTGGISCLFLMGVFMPRIGGRAAFAGLVANYIVCAVLRFAPWPGKPHLLFYGACGIAACLAVAGTTSVFSKRKVSQK